VLYQTYFFPPKAIFCRVAPVWLEKAETEQPQLQNMKHTEFLHMYVKKIIQRHTFPKETLFPLLMDRNSNCVSPFSTKSSAMCCQDRHEIICHLLSFVIVKTGLSKVEK
jgi:hypothetical protein